MAKASIALSELVEKGAKDDVVRELSGHVVQRWMDFEIEQRCGAEYGERSEDRSNSRNAYRDRLWETRAGSIDMRTPKLRRGSYFPAFSSRGEPPKKLLSSSCKRRSFRAFDAFGRRARQGDGHDRHFEESGLAFVRRNRRARQRVSRPADRRRLAVPMDRRDICESAASRSHRFRRRGLRGVKLVISDAHRAQSRHRKSVQSDVAALSRVHFIRNALAYVGKDQRQMVLALINTVFAQETADAARAQWDIVSDQLRAKFPKLAAMLSDAKFDVLAFMDFPRRIEHRSRQPIRLSESTPRSSGVPTSSASSPTIRRSSG